MDTIKNKDLVIKLVCDKCRSDKVHIFHRLSALELKDKLKYFFQLRHYSECPQEYICKCGTRRLLHSYQVFDSSLNKVVEERYL